MRIHEIILEDQSVDEGFFKDIVGKAGGHVAGALGAAGRSVAGAWSDTKAGYADSKRYWDTPRSRPAPRPVPGEPGPAPGEPARKAGDVVAGTNVSAMFTGKNGQEWEIVGGKVWDNLKGDSTHDRRNRITRDASGKMFMTADDAKAIYNLSENKKYSTAGFYSKFLDQTI